MTITTDASLNLSGFSACCSDGSVIITSALTQEATATVRKYSRDFRHNRKRDFLECFAADVESGWREESLDFGVEIERSIFAEPGQQLSMTFSWP